MPITDVECFKPIAGLFIKKKIVNKTTLKYEKNM